MQRNEFVFAGVEASQLHGAFNGFGAAIAEESFREPMRRDFGDLLGQIGHRLHVIEIGGAVDQLVDLRFSSSNYSRIVVAGVDHRYSRETVEVLTPVLVPN